MSAHPRKISPNARWVLITGGLTLALAALMVGASQVPAFAPSPLNPGFHSTQAILWLELAHTPEEVMAALTPAEPGADIRTAIDVLHKYDFAFLVGYALYFAAMMFFLRTLLRIERPESAEPGLIESHFYLYAGLMVSPMIMAGDIMENLQLLKLTHYASADLVPFEVMTNLEVFTRMKWGAIFLGCAHLALSGGLLLIRRIQAGVPGKPVGLISAGLLTVSAGVACALGMHALTDLEARAWLELATLTMVVAWLVVLGQAGRAAFSRA